MGLNMQRLYKDSLIEISDESITLYKYYFLSLASKIIAFSTIEKIKVRKPTLFSGKWRIHGTGNFKTWYPFDSSRPKRDMIFIISLRGKWIQPAFTAENSYVVESLLRSRRLIQ